MELMTDSELEGADSRGSLKDVSQDFDSMIQRLLATLDSL
jgi:hypothetical protein